MKDETTGLDDVRPFQDEGRSARMLQYAILRTPATVEGKALLGLLAAVIEDNQPTPQISANDAAGGVGCEWLVKGRSVLVVSTTDEAGQNFWFWDSVEGSVDDRDLEFRTVEDLAPLLKSVLAEMGPGVTEEHRIIK